MAKEIAGNNGYDVQKVNLYVDQIETIQGKADDIMAVAKKDCLPHKQDIKEAKTAACEAIGCQASVLNAALKKRRLLRKAEAVRAGLEEDKQDSLDLILHALGDLADTPLGQAATGDKSHYIGTEAEQDTEAADAEEDEPENDEEAEEEADNVHPIGEADGEEDTILAEPGEGGYEKSPATA